MFSSYKEYSTDDWLSSGSIFPSDDFYTSISNAGEESSFYHIPSVLKQLDSEIVIHTKQTWATDQLRTVYFGNLPNDLKLSRFLNYMRGGMIDEVRYQPEKNCIHVTFVDPNVAELIYNQFMLKKLVIDGIECRAGWGPTSKIDTKIAEHIGRGATRNVFISNVDPIMTTDWLEREFTRFGTVESVKILEERRIAFVHMTSISSAVTAVAQLKEDSQWASRRIFYGRDRCCGELAKNTEQEEKWKASIQSDDDSENRTVYIGSLKAGITLRDICDNIRGGLLQHIKYFSDKKIAFATFISHQAAKDFIERSNDYPLYIKSKRAKLGWGRSHPFPTSLVDAVAAGATRNVYVGQLVESEQQQMYDELFQFGEIEFSKYVSCKQCGFFNFTDISCAIRAVETLKNNRSFSKFRFGYGKDRCSFPFKNQQDVGIMTPPASPK